jgi:hypothetical protein
VAGCTAPAVTATDPKITTLAKSFDTKLTTQI